MMRFQPTWWAKAIDRQFGAFRRSGFAAPGVTIA
jgi:hypothetical protein